MEYRVQNQSWLLCGMHGLFRFTCAARRRGDNAAFNLAQILLHFDSMSADVLRKIRKKADVRALFAKLWTNKRLSLILFLGFVLLMYVLFNNQGVIERMRLEHEKKEMLLKIQTAEQEQKQLQEQSKALEGDKKAVEKVAREKYGMVREGEKVYRVAPKK